ncbi:MAG: glutathione S-transferase N-terminal domain-containing protein [Lachnospiraceae bacterium]|nr:glutathione S-transferase N-terminal domain-containing protein [Lachnospiraceae bacterium]
MKLELFKFETCPYCRRVLDYLAETGRTDVELRDIHESKENEERLVREGGKKQVPCLFIDGKPMYESLDIIAWLKEHPQA